METQFKLLIFSFSNCLFFRKLICDSHSSDSFAERWALQIVNLIESGSQWRARLSRTTLLYFLSVWSRLSPKCYPHPPLKSNLNLYSVDILRWGKGLKKQKKWRKCCHFRKTAKPGDGVKGGWTTGRPEPSKDKSLIYLWLLWHTCIDAACHPLWRPSENFGEKRDTLLYIPETIFDCTSQLRRSIKDSMEPVDIYCSSIHKILWSVHTILQDTKGTHLNFSHSSHEFSS